MSQPADKIARRAIRVSDLFAPRQLEEKLGRLLDLHNFLLARHYNVEFVDARSELERLLQLGERVKPMVVDVTEVLRALRERGSNVLFEGAQGAMLDIDLGTYPFVTSSNTTVGGAAAGMGIGSAAIDYVLGIVKAYTTCVGVGFFLMELQDEMGCHFGSVGNEFGSTTGRPRRCGWFDAVLLRRAVFTNSIVGLCLTKLDVLDGLVEIKICVGYRLDGQVMDALPLLMYYLIRANQNDVGLLARGDRADLVIERASSGAIDRCKLQHVSVCFLRLILGSLRPRRIFFWLAPARIHAIS